MALSEGNIDRGLRRSSGGVDGAGRAWSGGEQHRAAQDSENKGCLNRKTALAMTFKLILSAKRKWRKLNGSDQLADIIDGVPFKDRIKQIKRAA